MANDESDLLKSTNALMSTLEAQNIMLERLANEQKDLRKLIKKNKFAYLKGAVDLSNRLREIFALAIIATLGVLSFQTLDKEKQREIAQSYLNNLLAGSATTIAAVVAGAQFYEKYKSAKALQQEEDEDEDLHEDRST